MPMNDKRRRAAGIFIILAAASLLGAGCQKEDSCLAVSPSTSAAASPSTAAQASYSPSAPSPAVNKGPSVEAITLGAERITLPLGQTLKLTVSGVTLKQGKQAIDDSSAVTFTSGNPEIVEVDKTGSMKTGNKGATGLSAVITAEYQGKTASTTVTIKYALEDTVKTVAGKPVVTNETDTAVLVNKQRGLPDQYAPKDLTEPKVSFSFSGKSDKRLLRKEAAQALEELFAAADKDGIKLYGVSGYRSRATQESVYNSNVKYQGQEAADKVSAKPGYSEHQTGLAIDVSSKSAKFGLEEVFGSTEEGKWLAAHAHEAGFIIRYPKGKEHITGYSYEPWHIRYVGKEMAGQIFESKWTLEEYFQDAVPVNG
jgi:zinc D-Ala-D-Ala carboxypeptidase